MKIKTTSQEDYLKAIFVLEKQMGEEVHSVDVARYLGFSKPSVSQAVGNLSERGLIYVDKNHILHLTKEGRLLAEKTYERHCFFTNQLLSIGVDMETAQEDACKLEHAISDVSFQKLKEKYSFVKCCL